MAHFPRIVGVLVWLAVIGIASLGCLPAVAAALDDTIAALSRRYDDSYGNRDYQDALLAAREAYELGKASLSDTDPRLTVLARNYGQAALKAGGLSVEARDLMEWAVVHAQNAQGPVPDALIEAYLGSASAQPGAREALREYKRAIKVARKHHGQESREYIDVIIRAAVGMLQERRSSRSEALFRDAYQSAADALPVTDPMRARATYWRGRFEFSMQRPDGAIEFLEEAVSLFDASGQGDSNMGLANRTMLIKAYEQTEQPDRATAHLMAVARVSVEPTDDREAHPIYRVSPVYPPGALRNSVEGAVVVEILIDADGSVADIEVVGGTNTDVFSAAATGAIREWRFAPKIVDGEAVARRATTELKFRIAP